MVLQKVVSVFICVKGTRCWHKRFFGHLPFSRLENDHCRLSFSGWCHSWADTRATEGPIIADKNCRKIHHVASSIYCCVAGTAADTEAVIGRESKVVTALSLLKSHLFSYQGYVPAALVLVGVDFTGPYLHTIYPHGSTDTLPCATMGSGSLGAMAIFEPKYREGLSRDGIKLVAEAICSGIFNDLGSGSNVDICVLTKGHKKPPFATRNQFPKKTEVLQTKIAPLKDLVEIIEGGDAMEE